MTAPSSSILKTSLNSTIKLLKTASKRKASTTAAMEEVKATAESTTVKLATTESLTVATTTTAVAEGESVRVAATTTEVIKTTTSSTTKTKIWPNIFVAFRIQNPVIVSKIDKVQKKLIEHDSKFSTKLVPLTALHITLMVGKMDDEEIPKAVEAMQEAAKAFGETNKSLIAEFHGISSFGKRVLFGDTKEASIEPIRSLQKAVIDAFKSQELTIIDDHPEFNPHITIARCQYPKRDKNLAQGLITQKSNDYELGIENIKEILLCRMASMDKTKDEFYKIIHSQPLFDVIVNDLVDVEIK